MSENVTSLTDSKLTLNGYELTASTSGVIVTPQKGTMASYKLSGEVGSIYWGDVAGWTNYKVASGQWYFLRYGIWSNDASFEKSRLTGVGADFGTQLTGIATSTELLLAYRIS